jgi:hypothetical protein
VVGVAEGGVEDTVAEGVGEATNTGVEVKVGVGGGSVGRGRDVAFRTGVGDGTVWRWGF